MIRYDKKNKNMRKRAVILLAILIAIFGGSVNAQSFLGKLVDDKEAPVGFANVVLLNPEDSAFVKGTVSEESGEFVLEGLKEQCYILRVSYIGYKDISKLDSEEQFLGRIARSGIKNGIPGIVYFFNFDQAEKIYRDDYRMEKSLTLGNEEMRTVLKEKRFQTYYEQVMHYLKEMKNRKTSEEGLEYFFSESLKKLDFLKIQKRMELIEEDCWHVDIILCRKLVMEDGTEKDGRKIWEHYKELLSDYQMDYSEKKVKLSECQSDLNLFRYQIKRNIQIPYNEMIGELYCVYDGEQYFQDEKIDREKLEGDHMYFIDL